jgi:S-adenosylmethionine decarboxylase
MQTIAPSAYGLLLTLDGYGADATACRDEAKLRDLLAAFPMRLGMRALGEPHVVRVDEAGIRGLSGFTFIMESHISIHTYEERSFVTADVYSCRPFDTEAAAAFLSNAFSITEIDRTVLIRGHQFTTRAPLPTLARPHERP